MSRPRHVRSAHTGFVLVIVLMLLVVLTLLASAAGTAGSRAVAGTQEELDRFQGQLDMASTAETVRYMMVTQRINLGGLSVIQAPLRIVWVHTRTTNEPAQWIRATGDFSRVCCQACESRDRVRAAIRNCGFPFPGDKVTVELTPYDLSRARIVFRAR